MKRAFPILKLNLIKRFNTGIYDYSMMKSVFTPIPSEQQQLSKTLKVSTTRQDWCGHVYLQYNLEGDHYKVSNIRILKRKEIRRKHTICVLWRMKSGRVYELIPKPFR